MECRLCCKLTIKSELVNLFDERIGNITDLRFYVFLATGVEIKHDDVISKTVCINCLKETRTMFIFRSNAIKNDKLLKEKAGQRFVAPKNTYYEYDPHREVLKLRKQEDRSPVIPSKEILNNSTNENSLVPISSTLSSSTINADQQNHTLTRLNKVSVATTRLRNIDNKQLYQKTEDNVKGNSIEMTNNTKNNVVKSNVKNNVTEYIESDVNKKCGEQEITKETGNKSRKNSFNKDITKKAESDSMCTNKEITKKTRKSEPNKSKINKNKTKKRDSAESDLIEVTEVTKKRKIDTEPNNVKNRETKYTEINVEKHCTNNEMSKKTGSKLIKTCINNDEIKKRKSDVIESCIDNEVANKEIIKKIGISELRKSKETRKRDSTESEVTENSINAEVTKIRESVVEANYANNKVTKETELCVNKEINRETECDVTENSINKEETRITVRSLIENSINNEVTKKTLNSINKNIETVKECPTQNISQEKQKITLKSLVDKRNKTDLENNHTRNTEDITVINLNNKITIEDIEAQNIFINNTETEPHISVQKLICEQPRLKLPVESLYCHVQPVVKVYNCNIPNQNPKEVKTTTVNDKPADYSHSHKIGTTTLNIDSSISENEEDPLDKSMMVVTKENSVYICPYCNLIFLKRNLLNLHKRLHYTCKFCKRKFMKAENLEKHLITTCPHAYSDFEIQLRRCDEIPYLYDKYKFAFDIYNEENNVILNPSTNFNIQCDKIIEKENETDKANSSIKENYEGNQPFHELGIDTNPKKRKFPLPTQETNLMQTKTGFIQSNENKNKIKILGNHQIVNTSPSPPNTPNLLTNKRPCVIVERDAKKPHLHNTTELVFSSPPSYIKNKDTEIVEVETYISNQEEQVRNYLRSIVNMYNETTYCDKGVSTEFFSIIKENKITTIKNLKEETIPIRIDINPNMHEISVSVKFIAHQSEPEQYINFSDFNRIDIKIPLNWTKLSIPKKIGQRTENENIIKVKNDNISNHPVRDEKVINTFREYKKKLPPRPMQGGSNAVNQLTFGRQEYRHILPHPSQQFNSHTENRLVTSHLPIHREVLPSPSYLQQDRRHTESQVTSANNYPISISTQSSNNGVNWTLPCGSQVRYRVPETIRYPILEGNSNQMQNVRPLHVVYNEHLRNFAPTSMNHPANNTFISSNQTTLTQTNSLVSLETIPITFNNLRTQQQQQSFHYGSYPVQQQRVPSTSNRPQIRIKQPSEINKI